MEHIPEWCMVSGCAREADYWIDTSDGFTETLLATVDAPETFYMCVDHMATVANGNYSHIRIDTGEITEVEIAGYSCDQECEVCN
jgi:hypothetical protein